MGCGQKGLYLHWSGCLSHPREVFTKVTGHTSLGFWGEVRARDINLSTICMHLAFEHNRFLKGWNVDKQKPRAKIIKASRHTNIYRSNENVSD